MHAPVLPPCTVVVKSTLTPFDCTVRGGVRTMDAEPSILCTGSQDSPHGRMAAVAVASVLYYVLGVPVVFAVILARNRVQARHGGGGDVCAVLCTGGGGGA